MFKSMSNKEVYDNSNLSFTFEFFTPLNKREAAAKFARALGKKVKWFTSATADFEPTYEAFKVAPRYSNGYKEITLSTGFMPYNEAIHMMLKAMNVIEAIGYTTDRCSVKAKVRLNEEKLNLTTKLEKLNVFKYLLGLNETELLNLWPVQSNEVVKIHQNHLQFIQPRDIYNTVVTEQLIERMNPIEFKFPQSEFFANDFSELGRGQLAINYISGKDYTKKKKEAVGALNLIIEHVYQTLTNNYSYTESEKKKIVTIISEHRTAIDGTRNYFNFKMMFPNIALAVDLMQDNRMIEANYHLIREKIFKVIVGGGITEATINYDTRRKSIQIKDAVVKKSILVEGIEFFECKIEADAKNCLFEACTIQDSQLTECSIFSNNVIKRSKVLDCDYLGENNKITASYLDNSNQKYINADLSECLVNHGKFTLNSSIDKKTKVLYMLS